MLSRPLSIDGAWEFTPRVMADDRGAFLEFLRSPTAQRIFADLHPTVAAAVERARRTPIDEMGAYLPQVDVAGLRQPSLAGRVFAS